MAIFLYVDLNYGYFDCHVILGTYTYIKWYYSVTLIVYLRCLSFKTITLVFGITTSNCNRVDRPHINWAGISRVVQCAVLWYINTDLFNWNCPAEHFLKKNWIILTIGSPVKCLMPKFLQYVWNSKPVKRDNHRIFK